MQKKYVSVSAEVDTDGVIRPLLIRWHDGRQWEVTKVLHRVCLSGSTALSLRKRVLSMIQRPQMRFSYCLDSIRFW